MEEASLPFPQFQFPQFHYCKHHFTNHRELIAHMDKESDEASQLDL